MQRERKTGLDFLRIFATIQVILFHIYEKHGYGRPSKSFLFTFFSVLSKTNNFHFILISSYVGCKSRYRLSKTFPIILSTIFYSVLDYFDCVFFLHMKEYNSDDLFQAFFPLAYSSCLWFIFPFIVSQFLLSFIYSTFEKLNQRYLFTICIIMICIYSFPQVGLYKLSGLYIKESMGPFFCMGFIASYVRFHYKGVGNLKLILLYILLFIYNFYIHQHTHKLPFQSEWRLIKMLGQTAVLQFPSLIFSIPLFLISLSFTKQWKYHNIIQTLAESSIGVYSFQCSTNHLYYWRSFTNFLFIDLNKHWIYV